ncbi:MAG: T9SS type A sorting domain-containing protein, partial [Bacteroidales bacterium]|nr:T9SS type A sorting domain-containing protein [Bacteroidales bacterium]
WTAQSNAGWCTVTSGGTGNGTITATYTANTELSSRTATITVSGNGANSQTVTVVQAGAAPALMVSPSSQSVTAAAGTTNFTVTSNTTWTAQSNAGWCTVTSGGTGNGTITATYTANTELSSRTATITVSGNGANSQTVTVVQAGAAPALTVSPSSQSVTAAAGTTSFTVTSNTTWTAQSNAGWCTVTSGGTSNGALLVNYEENTATSSRSAVITVSADGVADQVVTVDQIGTDPALSVSPSNQDVSYESGTTGFTIASNVGWTAVSDAPWCTVTSSGSGSSILTAVYEENPELMVRTVSITISAAGLTGQVVTITQGGTPVTLTVSPGAQYVSSAAGDTTYAVFSNAAWSASSSSEWCLVTSEGTGNGILLAQYEENPTIYERSGSIIVSAEGAADQLVLLIQAGAEPLLVPGNDSVVVSPEAGYFSVEVTSNSYWYAQSDAEWCKTTSSGNGNGMLYVVYDENESSDDRSASIILTGEASNQQVIKVIQAGMITSVTDFVTHPLKIFPNPSTGSFTIAGQAGNAGITFVSLKDMTGRPVFCQVRQSSAGLIVDTAGAAEGLYIITLSSGTEIYQGKILIK